MEAGEAGSLSPCAGTGALGASCELVMISRNNTLLSATYSDTPTPFGSYSAYTLASPAPAYSRRNGSLSRPNTGDANQISILRPSSSAMKGERRPTAASLPKGIRLGAPHGSNGNRRMGTADSQGPLVSGSFISFSSLTGGLGVDMIDRYRGRRSTLPSFDGLHADFTRRPSAASTHGPTLDEAPELGVESPANARRRRAAYVTSPPMSAGSMMNTKEESRKVYVVESVKAAAVLEDPHGPRLQRSFVRPSTAGGRYLATAGDVSPKSGTRTRLSPRPGPSHEHDADHTAVDSRWLQTSPRPRTAPDWSSPSLPPSESVASQLTLMPRRFDSALNHSTNDMDLAHSQNLSVHHEQPPLAAAEIRPSNHDDALLAFLHTVDQDSREWTCGGAVMNTAASTSEQPRKPSSASGSDIATRSDEDRPRTARGTTPTSSNGTDSAESDDPVQTAARDHLSSLAIQPKDRDGRPSTAKGKRRSTRVRTPLTADGGHFSASPSRLGSSDSARPTTSAGGDIRPFGFGILPSSRGRSRAGSMREEDGVDPMGNDALGSVIQRQFAKLAAQADMPLDPPV
ncbi:hypothetical protein BCV70DRAFT_201491 [Testicularia cyperi]|uniref:Uncharacterized protein n=1 Tax=Testicularia cyperi TaxID=1882483 RepID=A0A317XK88_9BASI|nr:hypothetical protein BCV70DRAFT_201491 [Testicularia cyperi]